ncbi:MAG: hypothetical protein KC656_15840 [Myxococcales bacterium]|nr:hypothetical protein [Myxococcales bacterium]
MHDHHTALEELGDQVPHEADASTPVAPRGPPRTEDQPRWRILDLHLVAQVVDLEGVPEDPMKRLLGVPGAVLGKAHEHHPHQSPSARKSSLTC